MFGFLKDKLKGAIQKFTKKVEKEIPEEVEPVKPPEEKKSESPKKEPSQKLAPTPIKISKEAPKEKVIAKEPEKKEEIKSEEKQGFFSKIFGFGKKKEVVEKLEEDLEEEIQETSGPSSRKEKILEEIEEEEFLEEEEEAIEEKIAESPKPVHKEPEATKQPEKKPIHKPEQTLTHKEPEKIIHKQPEIKQVHKQPEIKPTHKSADIKESIKPIKVEPVHEPRAPKILQELKEKKDEKKGFFGKIVEKITTTTISEDKFEELFEDLEIALLENNVALEVIDKIKAGLKAEIVDIPISRSKVAETIGIALKQNIEELFDVESFSLMERIKKKIGSGEPYVIAFVGVNGSGKTTTIAKMAKLCLNNGFTPVVAAADTFRAAAIDQLETHTNNLGVKLIKHDYGSDSAAVAFDAVKHAKATGKHVVLIDTAGRLHSNINLMDELKKVIRVAKPDSVLFIGESITGNDCVEQAKKFSEYARIDGIILAKADIDEKGGAAVSISYVTKKPILYLGVGQGYDDLIEFDPKIIMKNIGLEA